MRTISFIGLGRMGAPMAGHLIRAGYRVIGYDVEPETLATGLGSGADGAETIADAVSEADVIITMVPDDEVEEVYLAHRGVLAAAPTGCLLIDCSTVSVALAQAIHARAVEAGFDMVDAPVSGGMVGAAAATLTIMVGGSDAAFRRAKPVLGHMGRAVVHAGGPGCGQAAKICNSLILGVTMVGIAEAFVLGERLGLAPDKLLDVVSKSTGQCWALMHHCPVPELMPGTPASHDYQPGVPASIIQNDLRLAVEAAAKVGAPLNGTGVAMALYTLLCNGGSGNLDFSSIIRMINPK